MPLLPDSPANQLGSLALSVDANGNSLTTDQRGAAFPRSINGYVDIGAVESNGVSLETILQQVLSPSYAVTVQANTSTDADNIISAVNQLPPAPNGSSETVTINLAAGVSYGDLNLSPPAGVTLIINGQNGTTTIIGQSPALTVSSGTVIVNGLTLTTATNAPTILVTGGSLSLRGDTIQQSSQFTDAAISVSGNGTVDLGTDADPGNNLLDIGDSGEFVHNTTTHLVPASGDTFTVNGGAPWLRRFSASRLCRPPLFPRLLVSR